MKYTKQNWYALLALLVAFALGSCGSSKQATGTKSGKQYNTYAVAFYNMENLFDTEDDPSNKGDNDYLPTGPYAWTQVQYEKKLDNLARVISLLGQDHPPLRSCLYRHRRDRK